MRDRAGLGKRLHAWALAHCLGAYERRIAPRRRALLAPLTGTVLEIGPGTGVNLRFYHPAVRWIGVEPNPYCRAKLLEEAARLGRAVELRDGSSDRLDAPDAGVDAVVGTLVLCSVPHPERTLAEVLRVLRPAGRFVFLEHVVAHDSPRLAAWQRRLNRPWRFVADGCHPDRDTLASIENAGFRRVDAARFRFRSAGIVGPHIAGTAEK